MFVPDRIIFENGTLDYEMGTRIFDKFKDKDGVEIIHSTSNKVKSYIEGDSIAKTYQNGKRTLVVSKKRVGAFQTCKPSADYMLPLVSGCMGQCEYCYLHKQLGDKPFVRVFVNLEDIYRKAKSYMDTPDRDVTVFEGSATSDPLCIEPYAQSLKNTILFFANEPRGRFRFVTKYADVDGLLDLPHNGKTEIRFSINTEHVRSSYEHYTAVIDARIHAAAKVMGAGYPVGFLIAPVFLYENWRNEYKDVIWKLKEALPENYPHPLFFEVITHRFTPKAKELIGDIFPDSTLPMNEEERTYKHGQFGYGKYTYKKEDMRDVKAFFQKELIEAFPECEIKYII